MTNATTSEPASTPVPVSTTGLLGILSIIAGGVGIVFGHTVIVPLAAIVLGFVARSREPRPHTLANWGIALGFVGLFGWIVVGLLVAAAAAPLVLGSLFWMH